MNVKPETAAEVLAQMFKHAESGASTTPLRIAQWASRIERALSAQGEAVGEVTDYYYGSPVVRWDRPRETNIGTKLYTHPAPARVTEEMVERFVDAYVTDLPDPRVAIRDALTAALEADHG